MKKLPKQSDDFTETTETQETPLMVKRDFDPTESRLADLEPQAKLSPWWRYGALVVFLVGLIILIYLSTIAFRDAPPIPAKVVGPEGETLFTSADIQAGQQVFLKYGLMQSGSIWGHGGYMGPDYTATYLHNLAIHANELLAPKSLWTNSPNPRPKQSMPRCAGCSSLTVTIRIKVCWSIQQRRNPPTSIKSITGLITLPPDRNILPGYQRGLSAIGNQSKN
jgi:hypothetical protein